MECSRLWVVALLVRFYLSPLSLLEFVREDVVKPSLLRINSTEDDHALVASNCCMSVTRWRLYSSNSLNLIPILRNKRELVDVIHRVMTIPASKNEH